MNETSFIAYAPEPAAAPSGGIRARRRAGLLRAGLLGVTGSALAIGEAFAQATSTAGSLGAQLNTMSSEAIDSGGTALGRVCYIAALLCFVGGAWAFWQSRQPQNRESGYVAKGAAGLVLCGLLVMMPQWVNKAAHTVAGADATINNTPAQVKFAP
ncbi:MAG: hypothetical protein NVSMB18_37420 [Acetobacteraceae bacterium]